MLGWMKIGAVEGLGLEEVRRFDHGARIFAIYRSSEDAYFATDGLCTHQAVHLADGLVIDHTIECPLHSGVFDYRTGEAMAPPVCVDLRTHEVRREGGALFMKLED